MKKRTVLAILVFLNVTLLLAGNDSVSIGSLAPTFSLPDLEQKYVSLRDYCGEELRKPWINKEKHVVLISFFATWCKPCMAEIPHLESIAKQYVGSNVKIFLVDVGEDLEKVTKFVTSKGIELPVLIDRYQTVAKKYDALMLPRLFVLDKNGIVQKENKGFSDPEKFKQEITNLIDQLLLQ